MLGLVVNRGITMQKRQSTVPVVTEREELQQTPDVLEQIALEIGLDARREPRTYARETIVPEGGE
jgi:hypothetical protein